MSKDLPYLFNKTCSDCFFPVVDKFATICYHLVTRLMRPTDSQQVVPTSLIPSARNIFLSSCNKVDEANGLATSCSNQSDIVCT